MKKERFKRIHLLYSTPLELGSRQMHIYSVMRVQIHLVILLEK